MKVWSEVYTVLLRMIKHPEDGSRKILRDIANYKSARRHIQDDVNLQGHNPLDSITGRIAYAVRR